MQMHKKFSFDNLKMHTSAQRSYAEIEIDFPIALVMAIKLYPVMFGEYFGSIFYSGASFLTLRNRLGYAMSNNHFDSLDEIIFNFFKQSLYCSIFGQTAYLSFTPEATSKFILVCDSFKGKVWDDIIDTFVDEFYNLMEAGYLK